MMRGISNMRLAMLATLIIGMFISLFARLWLLQVAEGPRLQAQSTVEANKLRTIYVSAPRGKVLDRNGNVLIDNRLINEVVIDKFELRESLSKSDYNEFSIRLAREISSAGRLIKAVDIQNALEDQRYDSYDSVPIAVDVPERFSILIGEREDDFPGVSVRKSTIRSYPYGAVASHLLGYVGALDKAAYDSLKSSPKLYQPTDRIGIAGVEAKFEDILRGTPGVKVIEVDRLGAKVREVESSDPIPGNDIRLTLDINLQAMVEQELADEIRATRQRVDETNDEEIVTYKAPGGAFVLLDPDGAKVLAIASFPTYDQRTFLGGISETEYEILRDDPTTPLLPRAVAGSYPPGSTFKLMTSYAAMDSGLLSERGFLGLNAYLPDIGYWNLPPPCAGAGCVIVNDGKKPLGDVDLRLAIEMSSNVYFGQLGYQFNVREGFSSAQLAQSAVDFGYGIVYDGIPEAIAGKVPVPKNAGQTANMAVGQGQLISTPLQMANSFAVLANRGKLYSPLLAEASLDAATGETLIEYSPRLLTELYMPDEFYDPMMLGLEGVTTSPDGTAYEAFSTVPLPGFRVLGKTGTVEVAGKQSSSAFAAFGPWPNPKYVAQAYLEEAGFGSRAAAPLVARVFSRIATNDIEVVPTEAEVQELISEKQALLEEEARVASEREAAEELAQESAELPETGSQEAGLPQAGSQEAGLPQRSETNTTQGPADSPISQRPPDGSTVQEPATVVTADDGRGQRPLGEGESTQPGVNTDQPAAPAAPAQSQTAPTAPAQSQTQPAAPAQSETQPATPAETVQVPTQTPTGSLPTSQAALPTPLSIPTAQPIAPTGPDNTSTEDN